MAGPKDILKKGIPKKGGYVPPKNPPQPPAPVPTKNK